MSHNLAEENKEMPVVFVRETVSARWSQGRTVLQKDQAWDSEALLVRERPDLFRAEADEPTQQPEPGRNNPTQPKIERATRAPGERRGPRQ